MSKYLRTVDSISGTDQKVIYKIDSCTHCPLMRFHDNECIVTCRTFMSKDSSIIDPFVVNYDERSGEVFDEIEIPSWCSLADNKSQLDFDTKTYIVSNIQVLIRNDVPDMGLPMMVYCNKNGIFIHDQTIEEKENIDLDVMEMLPTLIANSLLASGVDDIPDGDDGDSQYEQAYSQYEEYHNRDYSPTKNKFGICSSCGEEDETVNRNTNHGMCNSCWEVSYNNDAKKKQSFLNNFRIKRGISFKSDDFNLSVLKTDNLKVLITI